MSQSERTALYEFFDVNGDTVYVGVSSCPGRRYTEHRTKTWMASVQGSRVRWFDSREQALHAEHEALKKCQPKHQFRRRANQSSSEPVLVRLRPDLVTALRTHCFQTKQSMSYVMEALLDKWATTEEIEV